MELRRHQLSIISNCNQYFFCDFLAFSLAIMYYVNLESFSVERMSEGGWSVFDMNTSPVEWVVARLREANLTSSEIQLLK